MEASAYSAGRRGIGRSRVQPAESRTTRSLERSGARADVRTASGVPASHQPVSRGDIGAAASSASSASSDSSDSSDRRDSCSRSFDEGTEPRVPSSNNSQQSTQIFSEKAKTTCEVIGGIAGWLGGFTPAPIVGGIIGAFIGAKNGAEIGAKNGAKYGAKFGAKLGLKLPGKVLGAVCGGAIGFSLGTFYGGAKGAYLGVKGVFTLPYKAYRAVRPIFHQLW